MPMSILIIRPDIWVGLWSRPWFVSDFMIVSSAREAGFIFGAFRPLGLLFYLHLTAIFFPEFPGEEERILRTRRPLTAASNHFPLDQMTKLLSTLLWSVTSSTQATRFWLRFGIIFKLFLYVFFFLLTSLRCPQLGFVTPLYWSVVLRCPYVMSMSDQLQGKFWGPIPGQRWAISRYEEVFFGTLKSDT